MDELSEIEVSSRDREFSGEPTAMTPRSWRNRTVIGAGITSALGDFAYETSNVILPGFLAVLGVPAVGLGAIEGIADGLMSFTKLAAGHISNKLGYRKAMVVIGYAFTPVGQALIALANGWPLILLGRCLSWFGKGLRGPLRDTIIAESITPETRGRAFGFHRAMDTTGAVGGPLLGIALLAFVQQRHPPDPSTAFRFVFWLTLVPGIVSFLCFALMVKDHRTLPNKTIKLWSSMRELPLIFKRYLTAVGIFGIGDFSHSMLILGATQLLSTEYGIVRAAQVAGMLYVGRNVIQTIGSYPIGSLADRIGHRRVLLVGYAIGTLMAVAMAIAFFLSFGNLTLLGIVFALAAIYTSTQEALEPSLTAEFVPEQSQSIAFGLLGAVNGFSKLVSSSMVGLIWSVFSPATAFCVAGSFMALGTIALMVTRPKAKS